MIISYNFHDQVWPRIFLLESGSNFADKGPTKMMWSQCTDQISKLHTHIIHDCSIYDVWETQFHGIQRISKNSELGLHGATWGYIKPTNKKKTTNARFDFQKPSWKNILSPFWISPHPNHTCRRVWADFCWQNASAWDIPMAREAWHSKQDWCWKPNRLNGLVEGKNHRKPWILSWVLIRCLLTTSLRGFL